MSISSFTYRGVWAGDFGIWVNKVSLYPSLADVRLDSHQLGGQDGDEDFGALLGPKFMRYEGVIPADSKGQFYDRQDALIKLIDPRLGEGLLIWDEEVNIADADGTPRPELDRACYARLHAPLQPDLFRGVAVQYSLDWRIPSGRHVAPTESTENDALASSPQTVYFPASALEVIGGNTNAKPRMDFTAGSTFNGTLTILNVTTGSELQWTGTVPSGDILRIDSGKDAMRERIEISGDGGSTWTGAMSGLRAGDEFPSLAPTVRNEFTITGGAAFALELKYRRTWM